MAFSYHCLWPFQIKGRVLSVPSKTPGQTIIDTAREEGCFAIVMGTRNRSKLQKAIMGSVSDHVIKHADTPVIVVRKKREKTPENDKK